MAEIAVNLSGRPAGNLDDLRRSIIGEGFTSSQADAIIADMQRGSDIPTGKTITTQTVSSKVYPPDLEARFTSNVEKANAEAANLSAIIDAATGAIPGLTSQALQAITEKSTGRAGQISAESEKQQAELNRSHALLQQFGLQADNQQSMLVDQLGRWDQANQQVQQIKPVVDQLTAVSPFANPVRWLFAQAALASAVPQLNAAVNQRESASAEIATRQAMMKNQESITPAITKDTITKKALADSQVAAAEATLEKVRIENATITTRVQLANEKLQAQNIIVGNDAKAMAIAAQKFGFAQQSGISEDDQFQLNRTNLVFRTYGLPEITTIQEYKALSPKQKELLNGAVPGVASPADTLEFIRAFNAEGQIRATSDGMYKSLLELNEQGRAAVDAFRQKNPMFKGTDADLLHEQVNATAAKWEAAARTGRMDVESRNNLLKMRAEEYARAPGLKNNAFAQYVLTGAPSAEQVTERDLVLQAVSKIKNGENADKVTAELNAFFKEGGMFQHESRRLSTLGVPLHKNAAGKYEYVVGDLYNAFSRLFGSPSAGKGVDLTDPTSTKHYLTGAAIGARVATPPGAGYTPEGNPLPGN